MNFLKCILMEGLFITSKIMLVNLIVFFGVIKFFVNKPGDFSEKPLSDEDILYFVTTTMSTVGYGDISPKSKKAKMVITLFFLTMLIEFWTFIGNKIKIK